MDAAIYETFARMSQPWINNIPEVDWHGANGSQIGGPECASSRYTEARLSKASEDGFFSNIKKNTVKMIPNFSEDDEWPELFPAIFPRLFVNGSQGIGLTIANVWVPGNLNEFADKVAEYLETGDITYDNIYPDFPSGGIIINKNELSTIYKTGRGRVILRGKAVIEQNSILISELPYQVYAEPLIDSIKELVVKEELKGIRDIFNKSDRNRILIEIECDEPPKRVLDNLYRLTDLQKIYNPNQYALISKVPQLLTLKDYIKVYIDHNLECLEKEYNYEIDKAQRRLEIVEGLIKAIAYIEDIIKLIRGSNDTSNAIEKLIAKYEFSENQAKAIVDMKLGRLAKLEGIALDKEKQSLIDSINNYMLILENLNQEFLSRLNTFVKKYGYARRTEVAQIDFNPKEKEEEYIEPEKCVVVMTESGLIKRIPASNFRNQGRNGHGVRTQDDITHAVIRTNVVDSLMIFSDKGNMYRLSVNDVPAGTNTTKGVSVKSLVNMAPSEKPVVIYSIYRDTNAKYVLFITEKGQIKKTPLDEYIKTRKKGGLSAITVREGDNLVAVHLVENEEVILTTKTGFSIRFSLAEVPISGRTTQGVKSMNLAEGDLVASAQIIRNNTDSLAVFTVDGCGKKMPLTDFAPQKRGGKGIYSYKGSSQVVATALVEDSDSVLIVGDKSSICVAARDIPALGRTAIGSSMIKGSKITSVSKV